MLTTAELNVSYNLDTNKFIFTDVTDYSSQSVTFADISGIIKVTAPSGVVYSGGSPDIDGSTGNRSNTTNISIPLLSSGTPEVGNYVFSYTVTDGVTTIEVTKQFNYQYTSPTVILTPTVDCLSPLLTSTDATNYLSGSVSPSTQFAITLANDGTNTLAIAGEKMGLLAQGDTFNIINSTGNNGSYTVTSISYNKVENRTEIVVPSLVDATVDGFVVTKTNTIYFPSVLNVNPLVGYTSVVTTNSFYSETQEFALSTTSLYDFGSGVSVVDTTSNTAELKVDCDVRLCDVYCCIDSVLSQYLNYCSTNTTLAELFKDKYILATSHLSALRQAFECGQDAKINTITQEIFKVTECNPDCSCSDDTPTPISGIGGGTSTVVATSGNGIEVSSSTVGSTTTYTVSLSQSILDAIAASSSTSSVSSSDASVTVTSTTISGNTDYDLSVNFPAALGSEIMSFRALIDISGGTASFTIEDISIQNESNFEPGTVSISDAGGSDFNYLRVNFENFQTIANNDYKVLLTPYFVSNPAFSNTNTAGISGIFNRFLNPVVGEQASGTFGVLFIGVGGYPLQRSALSGAYDKIYFNVQIIE